MAQTIAPTALPGRSRSGSDMLARGLGYFSIGLGLTELVAAPAICRWLGVGPREALVRGYGVREVATGVAILASHDPMPWIVGRIAGDALDIATLASVARADNPNERNAVLVLGALAGITALDALCAARLQAEKGGPKIAVADYSGRSGFNRPAAAMRGAARDFAVPRDMRVPDALRGDLFAQRARPAAPKSTAAGRLEVPHGV